MSMNPSKRSETQSAKNSAGIQNFECTIGYFVEYDPEHSPSSEQVEREPLTFMTINPSKKSQSKSAKNSEANQR